MGRVMVYFKVLFWNFVLKVWERQCHVPGFKIETHTYSIKYDITEMHNSVFVLCCIYLP